MPLKNRPAMTQRSATEGNVYATEETAPMRIARQGRPQGRQRTQRFDDATSMPQNFTRPNYKRNGQ